MNGQSTRSEPHIEVRGLCVAYDSFVIMRDLNFTIGRGDVFIIMGASGCGKSTLLKVLVGLERVVFEHGLKKLASSQVRIARLRTSSVTTENPCRCSPRVSSGGQALAPSTQHEPTVAIEIFRHR